jgi:UDPglucose--hexose-1-phosphate uridylyltransferase
MPQLRKDPISERWVIIATERARRPADFVSETTRKTDGFCPFCEGNESNTPPEIIAYRDHGTGPNTPGWRVRVVPNKFPALRVEGDLEKTGDGIYDTMTGIGAHEVIIESPEHEISITALSRDNVQDMLWAYRDRLIDLKRDKRLSYAMIFKNVGAAAGASLEHTHSQLIATPFIPVTVRNEMDGSLKFYNYRGRCIYCDIIAQELHDKERIVIETEHFVALEPYAPRFPFETWIMPKAHTSSFENIQRYGVEDLADILTRTLSKIEKALALPPYNYVLHSGPFDQAELAYYHWHIEIIPRVTKVAGFEWGTGVYINPVPPEDAARFLQEIDS